MQPPFGLVIFNFLFKYTGTDFIVGILGSPVQCRPSPSPVPEGLPEDHCNCDEIDNEEKRANVNRCPIHIKLRENCRNGRSLQQMLEVTFRILSFQIIHFYMLMVYFIGMACEFR